MKNRIDACFENSKQKQKALVTFITAGDPDMDTTENAFLKCIRMVLTLSR